MGWLSSILRMLAPIAMEHGGQVLRETLKSRAQAQTQAQAEAAAGPDPLQLLAADVDQVKQYALQLKSDLEALNTTAAEREERLRKWLLGLLAWNAVITIGLVLLAVFALHRG
ncbi:MAG TPA: hypothetical protein VFB79_07295 [Candidatus Angelobacter sp.]|nr:hypothetical protein [Candidatus Angelobacter sp.]